MKLSSIIQFSFYFVCWYAFNALYNIYNQKVRADFPFAFAVSTLQLLAGLVYIVPLWILRLRKRPILTLSDVKVILPIVILNVLGHITSVVAMFEKGGGTLTHVVKASEPVVSVFLAFLFDRKVPGFLTFISLLVIGYGVAFASSKGNMNWSTIKVELIASKAAILAMVANIAFALRSSLRKKILTKEFVQRTNMDPLNDHAATTIFSLMISLLAIPMFEDVNATVSTAKPLLKSSFTFLINTFVCGLSWYLYNEYQNVVLSCLGPVQTAVGNTLKRVAVFVAFHYFVPGEEISEMKGVGCAIAVVGCFLYAIFDIKGW
jgi:solute carrier family 35 protein E1